MVMCESHTSDQEIVTSIKVMLNNLVNALNDARERKITVTFSIDAKVPDELLSLTMFKATREYD